jgi:hypothetical protein
VPDASPIEPGPAVIMTGTTAISISDPLKTVESDAHQVHQHADESSRQSRAVSNQVEPLPPLFAVLVCRNDIRRTKLKSFT